MHCAPFLLTMQIIFASVSYRRVVADLRLDINDIDVHGGITFSEPAISGEESIGSKRKINPRYVGKRNPILDNAEFITDNTEIGNDWWIFGFDTFHYGDDKYNWDKQAVIQETMNLMEQIEK